MRWNFGFCFRDLDRDSDTRIRGGKVLGFRVWGSGFRVSSFSSHVWSWVGMLSPGSLLSSQSRLGSNNLGLGFKVWVLGV